MLYIVSTPIGNLKDITFRAVETLKTVALIAAEDTRHTKILLDHYGITTQTTSYFEHNKISKGDYQDGELGEMVAQDVEPYGVVVGNPARHIGWMCVCAKRIRLGKDEGVVTCPHCLRAYRRGENGLVLLSPEDVSVPMRGGLFTSAQ